jgi:hypothetical protein
MKCPFCEWLGFVMSHNLLGVTIAFAQWVERRLALNKLKYAIQAAL